MTYTAHVHLIYALRGGEMRAHDMHCACPSYLRTVHALRYRNGCMIKCSFCFWCIPNSNFVFVLISRTYTIPLIYLADISVTAYNILKLDNENAFFLLLFNVFVNLFSSWSINLGAITQHLFSRTHLFSTEHLCSDGVVIMCR